ncbi:MAG: HAD family hydrolase [Clostridiales bacterium]|nr:HAD family hydrolase [Clostridiales bacterium]
MKQTVVAIIYDFDKTLCTKDMQEYTFIPSLGMSSAEFWEWADHLASKDGMDRILASMYAMLKKSQELGHGIRRRELVEIGKDVEFFPGVEKWFERMDDFARNENIAIEHYVVSSGMKEIIEGTSIKKRFKRIFASEFYYGEDGCAVWPRMAVNYSAKTQFLFRINKGILNISDDDSLNELTPENERPVPFRNIIYIGDGMTDVPCMKVVKANGGISVAVYTQIERAQRLILDDRVNFIANADYSEGSRLDKIIKDSIRMIAAGDRLAQYSYSQKSEAERVYNAKKD